MFLLFASERNESACQRVILTWTKFTIECEDSSENIVHSIVELRQEGNTKTVAVYNAEGQKFPMEVSVVDVSHVGSMVMAFQGLRPQYKGGDKAGKSYIFGDGVESMELFL